MTLDTLPPRRPDRIGDGTDAPRRTPSRPVRRSGPSPHSGESRGMPSRSLIVALVLACITLMVVDKAGGDGSPVEPVRRVVGEVMGPVEAGVSSVLSPVVSLPGALRTNHQLRGQLADARAKIDALEQQQAKAGYDDNRINELQTLRAMAGDIGYALVPARVVAIGSAQSFSDTVTIDAGTDAHLHPDMTVVAGQGLVGRVTSVTSHTATVLLITDPESTVGGRIGDNMELGVVRGKGQLDDDGRLDLALVDRSVQPKQDQAVVTWGSDGGAPYVSGVPIGRVDRVFESVRETSYHAVLEPYVDFTSLDLVGVVVPSGTPGRVIEANESLHGGGR